ncbi:ATP-binding protein [Pseudomonas sp.]|uniref:ATP-binding protein n=1 Tax=Pseudomonas sp. TaxID=306 RepID=UPI00272C104D|nr:PAS domain-containing sensor histidine kinase [Pseudomonas sp.]
MPRVLLIRPPGVESPEYTSLLRTLDQRGLVVDTLAEEKLPYSGAEDIEPAVILLPPGLDEPLRTARVLHTRWPRSDLLFLQPAAEVDAFRRGLGLAPLLGLHWSIEALDAPHFAQELDRAVEAGTRRQQFRATLARASAQVSLGREQAGSRRQVVADHYLASFIEFSQDVLIGLDRQLHILFWSEGAVQLTGVAAGEAVGQSITDQAVWNPVLAAAIAGLGAQGRSQLVEVGAWLQGSEKALEILCSVVRDGSGESLGYSLMIRDVTELRLQKASGEAILHAEHQHLHQLFHQAPGFVAVTRFPDHRIELANRAFHQLVGSRQLTGQLATEVFPELEGQSLLDLLNRVHASRRPFIGRGIAVRSRQRPTGPRRLRYLDFIFQPVLSADGTPTGIFCQGHDVTAEVQLREQLKRSEEHLEALVEERTRELRRSQMALYQSQKLEAVGKLTGGVAHDFNNVLQIIGANLQLLRDGVGEEPRLLRRLESAMQAVERGARLSAQLLAFARRQPLSPAPTDLGAHLHNMDELLRQALGERIHLELRVPGGLWTTMVDPHRLENVVLNLVINARDAMPDGGRLTLELANLQLDAAYAAEFDDLSPGHYVMLSVADTGCGMPAEVVEQVFEPFFTTKPEGKGTGLGLSMAYGFAKQSGGHIRLLSEPGRGTTVSLYLPRTLNQVVEPAPSEAVQAEGGNETILVVEDDPDVQAAVIDQLAGLGYEVLRANDAQSALSILQSGIHVDLLFTDVVMPGPLRSTELARRARLLQPTIAVLFTSGYSQDAIMHDGRLDEGVELLSKPYRRDDLARQLRLSLTRHALPDPDATEL